MLGRSLRATAPAPKSPALLAGDDGDGHGPAPAGEEDGELVAADVARSGRITKPGRRAAGAGHPDRAMARRRSELHRLAIRGGDGDRASGSDIPGDGARCGFARWGNLG